VYGQVGQLGTEGLHERGDALAKAQQGLSQHLAPGIERIALRCQRALPQCHRIQRRHRRLSISFARPA
jgi:hypothetical protein